MLAPEIRKLMVAKAPQESVVTCQSQVRMDHINTKGRRDNGTCKLN